MKSVVVWGASDTDTSRPGYTDNFTVSTAPFLIFDSFFASTTHF